MPRSRFDAVVVAAGASRRMGGRVPKPYIRLGGKPVLAWVLASFEQASGFGSLVIVSAPSQLERARRVARGFPGVRAVVAGGRRRQDSVFAGIRALGGRQEVVLIHDAARPFASPELIGRVAQAARRSGAALAAAPIADTVKQVEGRSVRGTLDRSELMAAQTPQGFRFEVVWEALRRAQADGVEGTDEAQLVERMGMPVEIVVNQRLNLKLTTPEDLRLARAFVGVAE